MQLQLGGVIFDLDGTLGDTLPVAFAAFRRAFSEFLDVEYSDAEIRAMFGPTEEGILAARIPHAADRAADIYLDAYAANHHLAAEPFDGIVALLDTLDAARVPAAIVTGKGRRSAMVSLGAWGLTERFHPIEAGGDDGPVKAERMGAVIAGWGVDPASVVSVGDVPSDVAAARVAGAAPVAAAWSALADVPALRAAGPDAVFERVVDFAAWLEKR